MTAALPRGPRRTSGDVTSVRNVSPVNGAVPFGSARGFETHRPPAGRFAARRPAGATGKGVDR